MNCSKFVNDIALYAGGDLPDGRIAPVEAHLAQCSDCRALSDELRAGQALLGELRDEPLEDLMVAQVRRRVMAQVGVAPRQPSRLYWKLALAAALLLAAVLLWPRHAARHFTAPLVARVEPPHVTQAPRISMARARHRIVRRHHRRAPATAETGPPLLVQFVTDNPNIVVYWLVDQKPQGD
jgi:anti-sigma factor RsiW